MKKTVVFDLKTNTGNSIRDMKEMSGEALTIKQRMDEIEDATRNISKATRESDATSNMEKLNRVVEDNVLGWQEMGQAVDTYRNIARAAGTESPIGQEALQNAAALEREMENLQTEIASLSTRGRELQSALQLGTGVVAGYSAFQGVTAMLGVENEKMLETITKLQAAQSALMGVEQLRLVLERDSLLMVQARIVATRARTVATNLLSRATAGATVATKAFSAAMSVTILGAITAAVALLVANWEKLVAALTPAISKTREMVDATTEAREASEAAYQAFDEEERRLRLLGETELTIGTQRRELAQERLQAIDREMQAQQLLLEQMIESYEQAQQQMMSRSTIGLIQSFFGASAEDVSEVRKQLDELTQMRLKFSNDILEIEKTEKELMSEAVDAMWEYDKKVAEEQQEEREKQLEAQRQADQEAFELEEQKMMEIRDLRLKMYGTELEQLQAKHADEREQLIEKYGADTELLMLLEQQQREAIDNFKATKDAEELEKRKALLAQLRELEANDAELARIAAEEKFFTDQELLAELREMELITEEEFLMKQEALRKRYQDQLDEIQRQSAEKQAQMELNKYSDMAAAAQGYVQSAGNFLTNLNKLSSNLSSDTTKSREREAKRQFAIDKAVAIAQATISGALGIVKTIGSVGMPAAIPFIALSAITTAASIAAIASEQFQGGGGGGGGGSFSAPSVSAPATPVGQGENRVTVGDGGDADVDGALNNPPQSAPQQVVVLASDVQDVNNENQQIDAVSTFDGGG